MTRRPRPPARAPSRLTHCSRAALVALGALAVAGGPAHAANPGTVLPPGTIPQLRGLVSDYAGSATFMTTPGGANGGQTLTINQLVPKLIVAWNNFDIGNGSTVQFIQPSASAAALNRIYSQDPTIIQGAIKANGQVYLVNQNGILFDRGTQINVNTLVASSLNIDDAVFQKGVTTGGLFTPAFAGGYDATGKTVANATPAGKILVGASGPASAGMPQINATTGGAVVIIAPVVDNRSGVITSPDGQVILAAGNSAYLGFSATNDPGFRGMLVEVTAPQGQDVNLSSYVSNAGTVTSDRGNVTFAGLAINQAGRVSANSAMLTNGSIYLQGRTKDDAQGGSVTLTANSVTETPLDTTDTTTMHQVDDWTIYRPVVKIDTAQVDVEGRITSPSGAVSVNANDPSGAGKARIYLGAGSTIDASGVWSSAADSTNLLTFKVTSNELADSPDQKGGVLLGATVTVNLNDGSPLLDLQGYRDAQSRTLAQKASQGGIVNLTTTGDLVERADATVNVSGGGTHYTGGLETTTTLLGADGKLYDITSAPEQQQYTRIADSFVVSQPRWGYSQTYSNLLMGAASVAHPAVDQGAAGGTLQITMGTGSNGLVLDGHNLGGVTTGSQQLAAAPRGGSLSVGFFDPTKQGAQDFGIGDVTFVPGDVSSLPAGFGPTTALGDTTKAETHLSTDLFAAAHVDGDNSVTTGFSNVTINANGRVTVPENVTLAGPVGGVLTVQANQVEIDGHVSVPSGTVALSNVVTAGSATSPITSSAIVVAHGAGIDTRGTWTNNSIADANPTVVSAALDASGVAQPAINGGTITLDGAVVTLQAGSTLDVSAGGSASAKGVLTGGAGGSISLTAADTVSAQPLTLAGTLVGDGFTKGGSLSITTSTAGQVGGPAGADKTLNLAASFFDTGAFSSYSVTTGGDLTIASGTSLQPRQSNLQFDAGAALLLPTGGDIDRVATATVLPDNVRKPASLSLASANGKLAINGDTAIATDAGGSISLSGATGVAIDGAVSAPGGTINVSVNPAAIDNLAPAPQLELGATGVLSARGTFVQTPNDHGLVQGKLWDAGSVNLKAQKATIALDAGSVIDVSGASQLVDQPGAMGATQPYTPVQQSSNAGLVSIAADDTVTLAGALRANADRAAAGGTFALTFNDRGDFADTTSGRRIVVSQTGAAAGPASTDKDVLVSADKLAGGGFDKLRLTAEDQIDFATGTTLNFQRGVTLDTQAIQVADGASVLVRGASVMLADSYGARVPRTPGDPTDPRTTMDSTTATLPQATVAGSGSFAVQGNTVDVFGSVLVNGASSVSLSALDDLRLSGRAVGSASTAQGAVLQGSLTTAGNLTLRAAQVYPTTGTVFNVAVAGSNDPAGSAPIADGRIDIESSGATPGAVYSAGGSLTLAADHIEQAGVVKAPLGTLAFDAGKDLALAPRSVTSVSAGGLTIPYGETQSGVTWTYAPTGSDPLTTALSTPPSKRISLNGPAIDVQSGATVDVSGGGDLAAFEFVQGSGGSKDALAQPNTYAIIPAANLSAMPVDPDIALSNPTSFGKDGSIYNSIRIGPGGAVPAGDYVLLPGDYALLKGGYMVQLLTGSTYATLQNGQTATLANGQVVVPGVMAAAGTSVASASTIGVVVRPGSDVSKLADYTVTTSSYFATLADKNRVAEPRLPSDGGQLAIAATQSLSLAGALVANLPSDSSRSAEVDIAASKIALVDQVGRTDIPSDYLQIDSASLSRLDASLLIGGTRSTGSTGLVVTPQASDILVANSSAQELKAPELILAATDSISVRAGSLVEGAGTRPSVAEDFTVGGANAASGAVIRAANSGLVNITRPTTDSSQGSVNIETGATLASSGSLTIDATRTTTSSGMLSVAAGGGLSLVSGTLSLGDTDNMAGLASGLVLNNAQLAAFDTLGTLSLKSYGDTALYGQAAIGGDALKNLVLDTASITGHASADGTAASAQIRARQVTLLASSGATAPAASADASGGTLRVAAGQITIGAGDKTISGFSQTQLQAAGEIVAADTGSLRANSTLQLQAARIDSQGGANQSWSARDGVGADAGYQAVTIASVAPATPLADATGFGSRLQITGSSIADSGAIVMKAGSVTLAAAGPGVGDGVQLAAGATIDAGGAAKDFQGTTAIADAGQVTLSSANGNVGIAAGALVNVAAASAGGNAGSLSVQARGLDLAGKVTGGSGSGTQGSFSLDVDTLADFSGLNAALDAGAFNELRDLRVRSGDIVVGSADVHKPAEVVTAHHLVLESDAGNVTINATGRLDASAPLGGGSVEVYGNNVTVAGGALIDASGTSTNAAASAAYANGGSVTLVAGTGALNLAAGSVIDVRAGVKGSAGSVLLRAPRTADSLQASLGGQVLSQRSTSSAAGEVDIEGNRVYGPGETGSTLTAAMIDGYGSDDQAWMSAVNASTLVAGLTGDDGHALNAASVHVRPSVEVRAAGDLTIASTWDLTGANWLLPVGSGTGTATQAGSLVVRAAGDLTLLGASIGNPDTSVTAAPTWNIALTSGADLLATNPARNQSAQQLAAQSASGTAGAGDLVLNSQDAEASVRTGTGNIRLSAGRDFVIKSGTDIDTGDAVTGVVYTAGRPAITDQLTAVQDSRFTTGGGSIAITAGRDAIGAGNEWMTEWFRSATQDDGGLDLGVFWGWRGTFHDGVAAFGGGNVSIVAGRDVNDLSAWTPTSAVKVGSGADATLQTFGGGNVSVRAGNDILGGQYMASLGQAQLAAGGNVGSSTQGVQLYVMGATSDPALQGSTAKVVAGQSIEVHGIDNPGTLFQSQPFGEDPSFNTGNLLQMLSYSTNSDASLSALSGDVRLGNRPDAYKTIDPADQRRVTRSTAFSAVYPSQLSVTAFGGDITNIGTAAGAFLFPSASGYLKLLAGDSITGMNISVSDADPLAYAIQNVSESTNRIDPTKLRTSATTPNRIVTSTVTDPFVDDVVALGGSITNASFVFPQRSRVWAQDDIVAPVLKLQNTAAGDRTEVVANTGSIIQPPLAWSIGGPGSLLVQAGADIDLGVGLLSSTGNLLNQTLTDATGADITLLAGASGLVDVTQLDAAFAKLTAAGTAHDKAAAQAVIDALFANARIGKGDLDTFNTSVQSNAGGNINLLAPGGNITVGLTTPPAGQLIGILTTSGGAIRSYLKGDFDINRGKVVTAQGGDILIYTADGSIDAGKGAKTSATTPPPRRTPILDSTGALVGYRYTLPVAVSGSGIQTVTSKPNGPTSVAPPAGNIFLFAPSGTIDAGEAGIASGGNIFVAALTVLNADNITSAGSSVGVPTVVAGSAASALASSGATTSTNANSGTDAATAAAAAAATAAATNFRPAILTVEVMGFGDRNCKETDKDCFAK